MSIYGRAGRAAAMLATGAGLAAAGGGAVVDLVAKAAGINTTQSAGGLAGIVNAANGILTPLLIAAVAVGSLAMVGGGLALMLGHSRATRMIGGVVAALILIGGAKGIVA